MPLSSEEIYRIQEKRLVLKDPELKLDVDLPFDPVLLPQRPMWGQEIGDGCFVAGTVDGSEFYIEKEGQMCGQSRLYYPSKAVKGEMYYQKGKLHGPAIYLSEKGNILVQSWYLEGLQEGKCHWFYTTGEVYGVLRFRHGVSHGKQEYYRLDGSLKTLLTYQDGTLVDTQL